MSAQILDSNITVEQVVGLLDDIGDNSALGVAQLSGDTGMGADLLPILNEAQALGLVRTDMKDVSATELGLSVHRASTYRNKVKLLKDRLSEMEPCMTAVNLVTTEGRVSAKQIANELQRKGVQWHEDKENNEAIVEELLVDWAIGTDLLNRNKKGEFVSITEGEKKVSGKKAQQLEVAAHREYRKSMKDARRHYFEARRSAWKTYKNELKAARKAHKEAISKKNIS